ncbi:putative Regulatory protein RecX [uncultured Gammaproteobacteria bacterium]
MAVADDVRKRYAEYIKLQAFDDRFVSRERERKMLGEGVTRFEIPLEEARAILKTVALDLEFLFEKDVDNLVKDIMQAFSANDGFIGLVEFQHGVQLYKQFSCGYIGEADSRRRLKQMMLNNDWKPKRHSLFGTRKWFQEISDR